MKTLFKGVILSVAILGMILTNNARAEFIGTYCFKLEGFSNVWQWDVGLLGNSYEIVGFDQQYLSSGGSCMEGGGVVNGGHFFGTVVHTTPYDGWRAIVSVDLNLSAETGTVDYSWLLPDQSVQATHVDLPIEMVPCNVQADFVGPNCKGQ
jgi:hypothetical protein